MLKKICAAVGGFVIRSCHDTGRIMQLFLDTAARLKNADARETIRQMSRLGADSLPIVLMTILFTGMVFALQTATELVRFGAASSVGGIVAIALGRELVPVLTGVVVAGRIGAAIAAELGTMKVTEQIDALKVMATNPITYLVVPRFLAAVLMMPVLIVFANGISAAGWLPIITRASVILHMLIPLKYLPIFLMLPAACLKAWFSAALSPLWQAIRGWAPNRVPKA